jgi:molecular chaperone GrpE
VTDNRVPATDHTPDEAVEPAEARMSGEQVQRQDQDADSAGRDVAAQLEDQLRRALADLDNLRKRYQRDLDRERAAERARLAAAWLPVVDHLELALLHADEDATALVAGVRAVHEQAVATLARLGFPRFDAVGQTFDPVLHEAVTTVDADAPPGTVVSVVRPGYGTPEALLRPAGVVVARQ